MPRPAASRIREPLPDGVDLLRRASLLGPRLPAMRPAVRSPADPSTIRRGLSESRSDETSVFQAEYAKHVKMATARLKDALFGASPQGRFDEENWEKVEDTAYKFALRAKVKPSQALQALYDHPEKWSFDCAEWVQVVNLYAKMKMYGEESVDDLNPESFLLRQHDSPGLGISPMIFERTEGSKRFDIVLPRRGNAYQSEFIDEDSLLAAIPIGCRVCFRNDPIAKDTPFRNENALKDGAKTFAAHPMGSGLSKNDVIARLASYNFRTFGEEKREGIFISQVEIFDGIPIGKTTHEALGTSGLRLE